MGQKPSTTKTEGKGNQTIKCWFGLNCWYRDYACTFHHLKKQCRFGPRYRLNDEHCSFDHNPKSCRFGKRCKYKTLFCPFTHKEEEYSANQKERPKEDDNENKQMEETKGTPTQVRETPSEVPSKGNNEIRNKTHAEEVDEIQEIDITEEAPTEEREEEEGDQKGEKRGTAAKKILTPSWKI